MNTETKNSPIRQEIVKLLRQQRSNRAINTVTARPLEFKTVDKLWSESDVLACSQFARWCTAGPEYQIRVESDGTGFYFQLQRQYPVSDEEWLKRLLLEHEQYPNKTCQQRAFEITGVWLSPGQLGQLRDALEPATEQLTPCPMAVGGNIL